MDFSRNRDEQEKCLCKLKERDPDTAQEGDRDWSIKSPLPALSRQNLRCLFSRRPFAVKMV
ncbi:MAG: hypothetical protein ACREDJ_09065, partial [Methylocella sp.]